MDFSNTCRTCLSIQSLNPIFEETGAYTRYSATLLKVAGIKVTICDGLPQNMCTDCVKVVNNFLKFRKQCKDVEMKLKKIKTELDTQETALVPINEYSKSEINKTLHTEVDIKPDLDVVIEIKEENHYEEDDDTPLSLLATDFNKTDSQTEVPDAVLRKKGAKKRKSKDMPEVEPPYEESFSVDSKKQRVTCKLCLKDLARRSIDTHMARMHPGCDQRKVKCDLCNTYVLESKLKRHVGMMHGTSSFRCRYCTTEFESRETLVEHVSTCNSKKRKRKVSKSGRQLQECDICHKSMQKASLKMHMAIKHAGLGPVCEHCGRKFGNKLRLNEHYRAKHGYEKFKCSYCDFQSAGILAMRNHERRHRGEKPFVCETCGAKFHAAYLLQQHRHMHLTEKTVKCSQCPAAFKSRNSLHAHSAACHGARVACGVCARVYACRHYARRHARHVHTRGGQCSDSDGSKVVLQPDCDENEPN